MTRTVIALYDEFDAANRAVRELKDTGFASEDISIMANDAENRYGRELSTHGEVIRDDTATSGTAEGASVGAGIGAVLGGLGGLLIGLGALTIPGIGPVIAAGPLAAALTGLAGAGVGAVAGGVAGGLIGALVDMGVPEETAQYYAEGVRRGGVLVTVRSSDEMTSRAVDILNRYNPVDINQRATQWRGTGWSGFDPNAPAYTHEGHIQETNLDRDRYTMGEGNFIPNDPARQGSTSIASDVGAGSSIGGGEMGTINPTGYGRDLSVEPDRPVEHLHEDIHPDRTDAYSETRAEMFDTGESSRRTVDPSMAHPESDPTRGAYRPEEGGHDTGDTFSSTRPDLYEPEEGGRIVDPALSHPESGAPRGAYRPEEGGHDVGDTYREDRPDLYRPEEGGNADITDTVHGHVDFSSYDDRFRSHFDTTFSGESYTYDYYQPAYRYGYDLATDERYRQYEDWDRLEPEARRYWDERNPGTWERFKMAVRHAWEEIKDAAD